MAQTVHELQANDPDMAAFVVECDERDKRYTQAPHAPPHQGDVTQRDKRVSIQSKGIKNTFPCLWLPVSFCVASRVHSLLSACPAPNNIDSSVQPVTIPTGPEIHPMVGTGTSEGFCLVNQRRKKALAGSVCQLSPPVNRPTCEFIHCPCSVCDQFRAGHTSWKKRLLAYNNQDVNVLFVDRHSIRRVTGILPKWNVWAPSGFEYGTYGCTDNGEGCVANITTNTSTQMVVIRTPPFLRGADGANMDSTGVAGRKKRRSLGLERQKELLRGK